MQKKISTPSKKKAGSRKEVGDDIHEKLMRSRQRLLDLTLRNRLLSFRPGNPNYKDDGKAHKHVVSRGHLDNVWEKLVEKEGKIEIHCLSQEQKEEIARKLQLERAPVEGNRGQPSHELTLSVSSEHWDELEDIRAVGLSLKRGNLISLLPEEVFKKRIKKIRHEQDTLINSTGDSALFLAVGFLEWYEAESHPRSGEPFFAPLVLVHVNLSQQNPLGGGQYTFHLEMDADQPQGNPCLAEKFRQDFGVVLPELEEDESAEDYLTRLASVIRKQKKWKIHKALTLGFFNFARYRLWLDLDPAVWPDGQGPADHNIVGAILSGEPLPQPGVVPDEETVAEHQATIDLPLVMDADSTQYAAMLGAINRGSMVIQGPPGSGKSQTITNLIAIALAKNLKVLFVAQKLPALQVVQRRLETVGLSSFCLPLFSDKARATSVHEHLKTRSKLTSSDYVRVLQSSVPPIANRLNEHATLLRSSPAGFSESVSQLIQRATATFLSLSETWGENWSEQLLEIAVPDAEPSGAWLDAREKTIHQWHRLKTEAGTAWTNWLPLKIGEMDAPKAETIMRQQAEAISQLEVILQKLPVDFHEVPLPVLEQLLAQLAKQKVIVLQKVVPSLLKYLWEAPENSVSVARMERDLEEFYRKLSQAQPYLRFTNENRKQVAADASGALKVVAVTVNPRCSLEESTQSLGELSDVLRMAEDLVAFAGSERTGLFALEPVANSTPSLMEPTWFHIDLFAKHSQSPEFCVQPNIHLRLAAFMKDDVEQFDRAIEFGRRVGAFHLANQRLKIRVGNQPRLQEASNQASLVSATKLLISHGFEAIALVDGEGLLAAVQELDATLSRLEQVDLGDLPQTVFKHATLTLREYNQIAALGQIPSANLILPPAEIRTLLLQLLRSAGPEQVLRDLTTALSKHKSLYKGLRPYFPWLEFGMVTEEEQYNTQKRIEAVVHALDLNALPVAKLPEVLEDTQKLKITLATVVEQTTALITKWPFNRPETLLQLSDLRCVFSLLAKCPRFIDGELAIALVNATTFADFQSTVQEASALNAFQAQHKDLVAFRDLPEPTALAEIRRLLRPYIGRWTRLFSSEYRKARAKARAFLFKSLPGDEELVALLDQLETHQIKRKTFEDSSTAKMLGNLFNGLETNWNRLDPLLSWLSEIRDLSTHSAVTEFVKLSWLSEIQDLSTLSAVTEFVNTAVKDSVKLAEIIKQLELLEQLLTAESPAYASVPGLRDLKAHRSSIRIESFILVLDRMIEDLAWLRTVATPTVTEIPMATLEDLIVKINTLKDYNASVVDLNKFDSVISAKDCAQLENAVLVKASDWLAALNNLQPTLISAILREELNLNDIGRLIEATTDYQTRQTTFCERFCPTIPAWLNEQAEVASLQKAFAKLTEVVPRCLESATICRIEPTLTFQSLHEVLSDLSSVEQSTDYFSTWQPILGESPSNLSSTVVEQTLKWQLDLRNLGAEGDFLNWLLTEETDNRLSWWQGMVARCQEFQHKVRSLQANFLVNLDEQQASSLVTWISALADRNAKTLSAVDAIASFTQTSNCTIRELSQAVGNLERALALEYAMRDWLPLLGFEPTTLTHFQVQAHRQWTVAVRSLSTVLGEWLITEETTARCELLLGLKAKLETVQKAFKQTAEFMGSFGKCSGKGPFGVLDQSRTPEVIRQRCAEFSSNISTLPVYAAMLREEQAAKEFGLKNILAAASKNNVTTELLLETFKGAVVYQQAKAIWESDESLRCFQSSEHERLRGRFQEQDYRQHLTNRRHIAAMISSAMVTEGAKGRTPGEHTELALLQHEMGKKRRHLPIRKLVERAGHSIQDLCPCWMMTPTAVGQFLPPGKITFDMVIMDEASQLNPEDAWGAITRGSQLIVVGDHKQMPPSDFFTSALEEDETMDEDDEIDGGKSESILVAAMSALWSTTLQWHYRSRHEALIAPANYFSYDNSLVLFPNPHRTHPDLGIGYHFVPGTTTTGKVTNSIEAEAIANHVRKLALAEYAKHPSERRSIGIVTMNLPQQDCVIDLITKLRNEDPRFELALSDLEADSNEEPFFVRNLENIQGDERDVMIISCTYGPQIAGGTPSQRFGPLNREGGERRFNVLITRAKCRMEVFSSIRSDQIVVDEAKRQGLRDFHLFLKYCETGRLIEAGQETKRGHDSPFEIQVEAVLAREGYHVEIQVGVAGYFIDLAVRHPKNPGLFAIGIECDGYTYHSSRAARDRDRLREGVLKDRGWKLHRIWSTDWFVNPKQAKTKLLNAVAEACKEGKVGV